MIDSNDGIVKIVRPKKKADLVSFIEENSSELRNLNSDFGAVVYRGFDCDLVSEISKIALLFGDTPYSTGEHPEIKGKNSVYSPVLYSPNEELLWHNENTFNPEFPKFILFGCIKPADVGGELTLVKSADVLDEIPPNIVESFERFGISYTRNFYSHFGRSWQDVFSIEVKSELEKICENQSLIYSWSVDGELSTSAILPAIHQHSQQGRRLWVAQVQHWHSYFLSTQAKTFLESMGIGGKPPKHCTFGDGTEIPTETFELIENVYRKNELIFAMEPNDLMVLDNIQIAHGRKPYQGKRDHVVSLAGADRFVIPPKNHWTNK